MGAKYRIISGKSIAPGNTAKQFLTGIDMSMPADGFDAVLVFDHVLDEILLVDSLKRALDENPFFAGRILDLYGENPTVSLEAGGVLFISESYSSELKNYGYERHDKFDEINFCAHIEGGVFDENSPIFQIKHSRFSNCSVLGFSVSHVFCDAFFFLGIHDCLVGYCTRGIFRFFSIRPSLG